VHALTCQVDPMLRFLKPYGPDISAFLQDMGATTDYYYSVTSGHELPTIAHVDPKNIFRGVTAQGPNAALQELVNLGLFKLTGATPTGYHALRPPGQRNNTSFGAGDSTPAQFGATHPYTRVTQDCSK
jgi:hypothetical protein